MADLQAEAAKFGQSLNPFDRIATGINKGVQVAGQVAEVMGVPGASIAGNVLSGNGAEVNSGSNMPQLQPAQAPPAVEEPSNLQRVQLFGGDGSKFPDAIETTGRLASGTADAAGAASTAGKAVGAIEGAGAAAGGVGAATKAIPLIL